MVRKASREARIGEVHGASKSAEVAPSISAPTSSAVRLGFAIAGTGIVKEGNLMVMRSNRFRPIEINITEVIT